MTSDGDVRAVIVAEDVVQHSLRADILIRRGFGHELLPIGIVLWEAVLELVGREVLVDIRLVAAAIAGMRTDALAQEFFYSRYKGGLLRQCQV